MQPGEEELNAFGVPEAHWIALSNAFPRTKYMANLEKCIEHDINTMKTALYRSFRAAYTARPGTPRGYHWQRHTLAVFITC